MNKVTDWITKLFYKERIDDYDHNFPDWVDRLPPTLACPDTQPTFPGVLETLPKES